MGFKITLNNNYNLIRLRQQSEIVLTSSFRSHLIFLILIVNEWVDHF